jgi:hypothetical protein
MAAAMKFSASHAKDARYEDGGLRSFFVYRDLGIKEATGGRAMAHVIRAPRPPMTGAPAGTVIRSIFRCTT